MQIKLAVMMMTMMMRMMRRLRLSCPLQVPSEPRASDRISEFPRSLCSLCSSAILSGSNVLHGHLISLCLSKETGSKAMAPWPQVLLSQQNCPTGSALRSCGVRRVTWLFSAPPTTCWDKYWVHMPRPQHGNLTKLEIYQNLPGKLQDLGQQFS